MKVFLLAILVAAVAAAPRSRDDAQETLLPENAVLPKPVIPVVVPGPAILPVPVLPELVPEPAIIPAPVLPELVPAPVILPEPVLPEVIAPEPVIVVEESESSVVVDPVVVVEESESLDVVDSVVVVEQPEVIVGSPALAPNGEVYNDGIVQVQVNTPQVSMLSTIQSWFSMVLNYFSNGVQTSQQII